MYINLMSSLIFPSFDTPLSDTDQYVIIEWNTGSAYNFTPLHDSDTTPNHILAL